MIMPDLKEIRDEIKPQTIISKYIKKLYNLTNISPWFDFRYCFFNPI